MEVLQSTDGIAWDHTDSSTTLNTFNSQLQESTSIPFVSLLQFLMLLKYIYIYILFCSKYHFLVMLAPFDVMLEKPPHQLGLKLGALQSIINCFIPVRLYFCYCLSQGSISGNALERVQICSPLPMTLSVHRRWFVELYKNRLLKRHCQTHL